MWLLTAADQWADDLLIDANQAAAQGRRPEPAAWTQDVYAAVGDQLPSLLARWPGEPPAVRFVLACLAGVHSQIGRQISAEITVFADQLIGTRPGSYLRLAEALVREQDDHALNLATEIVRWNADHDHGWLAAPGVDAGVKAGHVLADGASGILSATD
jgi:hypothetical protein